MYCCPCHRGGQGGGLLTNSKHLQKPLQEDPMGTGDDVTRGHSNLLLVTP